MLNDQILWKFIMKSFKEKLDNEFKVIIINWKLSKLISIKDTDDQHIIYELSLQYQKSD